MKEEIEEPKANSQKPKAILVFGCGELQKSIIGRAHKMGLFVVGIDPCEDAYCKGDVDAFEVVGGQDFEGTCAVVEKHGIDAIVTAATDKPLVMMARIAEKYGFPFYSVETAQWSTDKLMMKQRFIAGNVPHAKGITLSREDISQLPLAISHWPLAGDDDNQQPTANSQQLYYPVIVKPRDNSGSRGVKLCRNAEELKASIDEALENSKLDTVLVEEFIEGSEYSIESLHFYESCQQPTANGLQPECKSEVIQFTEKKTTEFPYNVELGHRQPANLTEEQKDAILEIVSKIGKAMNFVNCPSHTELKINDRGIFVIETSPRLGGDYITSTLTPLSTGIYLEDQLLHIAMGEPVDTKTGRVEKASGVHFFCFPEGKVEKIDTKALEEAKHWSDIYSLNFKLKEGDEVHQITSSLNRYGEFIIKALNRQELDEMLKRYEFLIDKMIMIISYNNEKQYTPSCSVHGLRHKVARLIPKNLKDFIAWYIVFLKERKRQGLQFKPFTTLMATHYCKKNLISPVEYLLFDFDTQSQFEKENYLSDSITSKTAWTKSDKEYFDKCVTDKYAFYSLHESYFGRKAIKVSKKDDYETFKSFCQNGSVFAKPLDKSMGRGAFAYDYNVNTVLETFNVMLDSGDEWIVEERITQHPIMEEWNQSSLNTVRVPTILCDDGTFHVMGTFMRTGRKGYVVDNAAAGGIFAVVDCDSGVVITDGIDKDGHTFKRHPDSDMVFINFKLPQWNECLELVEQAHRQVLPQIKYLAYDVAYTDKGWALVEANCGQFVSQFATKKGLRNEFLEYMNR